MLNPDMYQSVVLFGEALRHGYRAPLGLDRIVFGWREGDCSCSRCGSLARVGERCPEWCDDAPL